MKENKEIITGKIIEAEADAKESEEHIATGYLKISFNNLLIDVFVPDWRSYFPYPKKSGYSKKYGLGNELLRNLKGKKIKFTLKFVDYPIYTKILLTKEIGISLPNSANETVLKGKIVKLEKCENFPEKEVCYVDCGFYIFNILVEEKKFKVNDSIQMKGRLDIFIREIVEDIWMMSQY